MLSLWMLCLCSLPSAGIAAEGVYKLGPLDRVRVKVFEWRALQDVVFEWKALNDEFTIGPEGAVSLPLIGELKAAGLSTEQLGTKIAERFKVRMGFAEAPSVSVEVVKFRPFYIAGDVQVPGEYPFRPGLTVLQALTLAGGTYRDKDAHQADRDAISTKGELGLVDSDITRQLARRVRLEAELRGDREVRFPEELMHKRSVASVAQLLEQEERLFRSRLLAFETEQRELEDLASFYKENIDSLKGQVETADRQIALSRKESEGVKALMNKGLTNTSRTLGVERNLAQLEGERLKIMSSLSEARQELSKTDLAVITLRNKRANDIIVELNSTATKIEELTQKYQTTERLMMQAELRSTKPATKPLYAIVRPTTGEEIAATEATPVVPGDTIKVTLPPSPVSEDAAAPSGTSVEPRTDLGSVKSLDGTGKVLE